MTQIEAGSALSRREAVEADLRTLQNKGCLALHVWEQEVTAGFPEETVKMFAGKANALREENPYRVKVQSVTLLPTAESGQSVRPYLAAPYANPDERIFLGYLLSLDPAQNHPPLVLMACPDEVLASGDNVDEKDLTNILNPNENDSETLSFYRDQLEHWQAEKHPHNPPIDFYSLMMGYSPRSLDAPLKRRLNQYLREMALADDGTQASEVLAKMQEDMRRPYKAMCETNEVAVSATMEHMQAIAVPLYMDAARPDALNAAYKAHVTLRAALRGLEHIDKGYDLPVVMVHVQGDDDRGKVTYLAQGRDELMQLGLESLEQILSKPNKNPKVPAFFKIADQVKDRFGVDVKAKDALKQVQDKLGGGLSL